MSTQHTTATATPTPTTTTADEGVECGSSGEYVEEVVYEKVCETSRMGLCDVCVF